MDAELFRLTWHVRVDPLIPTAVIARGEAARDLGRRLLARESLLPRLRGVASPGLLLLLGEPDDIPWADGVVYLGRDPSAPALLLPTASAPDLPASLVERAILRAYPGMGQPLAVVPSWSILIPGDRARTIDPDRLRAWTGAV